MTILRHMCDTDVTEELYYFYHRSEKENVKNTTVEV